jgi:hypothetical protein
MKVKVLLSSLLLTLAFCLGCVGAGANEFAKDRASGNGTTTNLVIAQNEVRGAIGTSSAPRNQDVPTPGSGRVIPSPASVAASASWTGCRPFVNRFKEPFQLCCTINDRGIRSCSDVYAASGVATTPWKKPGCNSWKAQCNQGSASACANYETKCQVN